MYTVLVTVLPVVGTVSASVPGGYLGGVWGLGGYLGGLYRVLPSHPQGGPVTAKRAPEAPA